MSTASSLVVGQEGFRIGRVLSKSLEILTGNFPKYLLFGAVIAVPGLLFELTAKPQSTINPGVQQALPPSYFGVAIGGFLISIAIGIVVYGVCQSAMIYGAFQDIRGRPFQIGASIRRGLIRFLPVIGAVICAGILIVVGLVLFIVPGVMLLMMFFVIVPVCVVEGLGPIKSLGRSFRLTEGHRWRILAIYLIPVIVIAIINFVLTRHAVISLNATVVTIITFLVSAIGGSYRAIVNIVTYHDLRAVKEGLDIDQIAAVFD
jgi:hypothetical protein